MVPFTDLGWQWDQIRAEVTPRLEDLFSRSAFSLGPYVEEFEHAFAEWLGAPHVIAVNSGTSALHLAMIAARVGPGDEVLVPANTFIGTAWGVVYVGATPVFCDVDEHTGNIDVDDAERRISARTKAIIPVHLFGQSADLARVGDFIEAHGIAMIEDAAQAHGTRHDGQMVGTFGKVGCFSFYPGKNLGAAGEAGAIVTHDAEIAAVMRSLRNHGQSTRYIHEDIGFNYRMDGIQGLVLYHKLRRLEEWTDMRRVIARKYLDAFADLPLRLPVRKADHVYHLFVVRTAQRNELRAALQAQGIQTGLHYPVPLHRQPCFKHVVCDRDSLRVADSWADEGLSLPIFAGMTHSQTDRVISAVRAFF
jgi:dTDP-4-amino-4,6-dideoxygalactose transaminase